MVPHDHLRRDSRMSAAGTAEGHRLFRPEALEAQRQTLPGRILINTPLAHWLLAATAAALVAALFAFLWFAHDTPHIAEVACRCKRRFQWREMLPRRAR